jgi:RNA polymerase sigma-70 factor (ECF subfamily)
MSHESEYQAYDDDELTRLLAVDVDAHFPKVVWKNTNKLYKFVMHHFGLSQVDAEDILQEAMMKAYIALKGYPRERILNLKLKPWIYKITRNESLKYLEKKGRKQPSVILIDDLDNPVQLVVGLPEQPDVVVERKEFIEAFWKAFQELSQNEQQVLILSFVYDLTYAEIGILLDKPEGTIKSLVSRARKKLHKMSDDFLK